MWMGGVLPLGYDPPSDGSRMLKVVPDVADLIRTSKDPVPSKNRKTGCFGTQPSEKKGISAAGIQPIGRKRPVLGSEFEFFPVSSRITGKPNRC